MIDKRRLVETFIRLVKIDSLSLKEAQVVAYLQKELKNLGLVSFLAGKPRGGEIGNLIADVPGRGAKKPRLLLNAHVDTVGPGQKIRPIRRKNVIRTNGSTVLGADDKTGVAVILEVLRVLKENRLKHPPIRVIFTVAEEIGIMGAKALPKSLLKADLGIVLDSGEFNKILNQAPAQINMTAVIYGKAAHAGIHPENGINAIKVAAAAINKMRLGRIDKETTANIGVIKGGKATNIIPDEVMLKGEARSHDPKKLNRQIKQMQVGLRKEGRKAGAKIMFKLEKMYPAYRVKENSRIFDLVARAVRRAGGKPIAKTTGGGSDANIFNALGVPCLNLGTGMHNVHTTREYARISDMIKGAEVVLNFIQELIR
ncbi:MAG: M20/M25/M40 family metallo-hydrolase [Candidatus Margulisbacteria bacterium]|nr:M20/M25/M40 family metallo-hydrolase [Candidatus Margulisiibacteriota bacterium]